MPYAYACQPLLPGQAVGGRVLYNQQMWESSAVGETARPAQRGSVVEVSDYATPITHSAYKFNLRVWPRTVVPSRGVSARLGVRPWGFSHG